MKEYTKKQVDSIIKENMSDVDEMAYRQKGIQNYQINKETGNRIYKQCTPLWAEDNPTPVGGDGVPDAWLVNIEMVEGGNVLCVPLDCDDVEEFISRKKDFLEKLKVTHKLEPMIMRCGLKSVLPKYHNPVLGAFDADQRDPTKTHSFSKWAHVNLYPLLRRVFENSQVSQRLEELSLPPIVVTDRSHLDTHGETNQIKLEYATHTFNSYGSQQEFLEAVEARIFGEDNTPQNLKTYYLARQYNKRYRNWLETKKNLPEYRGKTPKYMLDKFGLEEGSLDVTVRADLIIKGELVDNNFVWVVNYITKFGTKLKESVRNLKLDKDLQVIKQIPVGEYLSKLVDPSEERTKLEPGDNRIYTLFNVPEVIAGLEDGLVEIRERLFTELDPVENLDKANIRAYDVDDRNLQESKFKTFLKESIINSIKKPLRK
jgi:hypothetical protein